MGKLRDQPPAPTSQRTYYDGPARSHLFRIDPPQPALTEARVLCDDMSADEYFATGVETRLPYELYEGVLTLNPPPTRYHQRLQGRLYYMLETWVRDNKLGELEQQPVDVRTLDNTVLQPDILFLSRQHPDVDGSAAWVTRPDLVIEIVSPHGIRRDRVVKYQLYEKAGIPNYWIVDPQARTIEAHELTADGRYVRVHQASEATFSAPPFPGLVINIDEVFGPEAAAE